MPESDVCALTLVLSSTYHLVSGILFPACHVRVGCDCSRAALLLMIPSSCGVQILDQAQDCCVYSPVIDSILLHESADGVAALGCIAACTIKLAVGARSVAVNQGFCSI